MSCTLTIPGQRRYSHTAGPLDRKHSYMQKKLTVLEEQTCLSSQKQYSFIIYYDHVLVAAGKDKFHHAETLDHRQEQIKRSITEQPY